MKGNRRNLKGNGKEKDRNLKEIQKKLSSPLLCFKRKSSEGQTRHPKHGKAI